MNIEALYKKYLSHPDICIDTRKISKSCLFFALKGPNFNGNEFAHIALNEGASYAIVDEENFVLSDKYILVDDVLGCLQELATYHRNKLNTKIIAITGSNGKTTSKELCYSVLKQKYATKATQGNLNNHIGVPLSLLSISNNTEIAIIEMGANSIGEIDFLCNIAHPDFGVITNVGKAHLEGFGDLNGVLRTKTELYRHLSIKNGVVFIKDNQQILKEMIPDGCSKKTYGQSSKSDYNILLKDAQPFVCVTYENTEINSQLIGAYNYDNIALSISMGAYFKLNIQQIKKGIENYEPKNNRSQLIKSDNNTILLDAYNANPMSVESALININQIDHPNKVIILGDMYELGTETDSEHIRSINMCISLGLKNVYLVGECFDRNNNSTFKSFANIDDLIKTLTQERISNSFILIKGSRGMKLEKLIEFL